MRFPEIQGSREMPACCSMPPFTHPALATEGDVIAFLEPETQQGVPAPDENVGRDSGTSSPNCTCVCGNAVADPKAAVSRLRQPGTYRVQVSARRWFSAAAANQPAAGTQLIVTIGSECFAPVVTRKVA